MKISKCKLISSLCLKEREGFYDPLFVKQINSEFTFSIRSLDISLDLPIIHHWVNEPYARLFWMMDVPLKELINTYQQLMECSFAHSFVGCLNGHIYCQMDVYQAAEDVVGSFYNVQPGDLGLHFLVSPGVKPVPKFSKTVLSLFAAFFFQSPRVLRLIAEPDERHSTAIRLLQSLCFQLEGPLMMPHKTAALFILDRELFLPNGGNLREKKTACYPI